MAIVNSKAPAGGANVVAQNLHRIVLAPQASGGAFLRAAPNREVEIAEAHRSYFVPLKELAAGRLLAAAEPSSWRYLIMQQDKAVAEVEIAGSGPAESPAFQALHTGPHAQATLKALRASERLAPVTKADFELRFLKIPSVYFTAIWLHRPEENILVPIGSVPRGLKENEAYSEAQVLAALADPITRALQIKET